jgi:hypothetical protein
METNSKNLTEKDENLWQLAKKRVGLKNKFIVYLIFNAFLWAIYFVTFKPHIGAYPKIPWPIWATIGWGFALAIKYYKFFLKNGSNKQEAEYQKLINN